MYVNKGHIQIEGHPNRLDKYTGVIALPSLRKPANVR